MSASGSSNNNVGGSAQQQPANMINLLGSMIKNPEFVSMAMQSIRDPNVQSVLGSAIVETVASASGSSVAASRVGQQQALQIGAGNESCIDLVCAGKQLFSSLQQSNPQLADSVRRNVEKTLLAGANQTNQNPPPNCK